MAGSISEDELLGLIRRLDHTMKGFDGEEEPVSGTTDRSSVPEGGSSVIAIENNSILIDHAGNEGLSIEALPPVLLYKNGKPAEGRVTVEPTDRIDWKIDQKPLFRIDIAPDHMKVFLTVIATESYSWKLKDKPPASHMVVEAEEDSAVVIEKLRLSDIMMALQELKISKNVKAPRIFKETQHPSFEPVLIAHGVEMVPSRDARLELYFSEKIESAFVEVEGSIDFRSHLRIPAARKGEVIARKFPPVPGSIGYDVFGQILKPHPPKDFSMIAKENTEITADDEVIALANGRPRVTGNRTKSFDITTAHIVSGDVDLKTGNIVFSGDVIVYGNVMEGMIIESLGNVYVTGSVYQGIVTATGSICVKGNILSSKLYSGYFGVIFNRLYMYTKQMSEQLNLLVDAARVLLQVVEARGKTVPFHQIAVMLVESKFNEIPKLAKDIIGTVSNIQNIAPNEMALLKDKMQMLTSSTRARALASLNEVVSMRNLVTDVYEMVERMQEYQSVVDIEKCHQTEIKSTGSVFIRGEGVLQSNLYAKEDILYLQRDAVFRGGQMECGGTISAYRVGGEHGSGALLKAGKRIILQRMTEGRLIVGKFTKDILDPIENVTAIVSGRSLVLKPNEPEEHPHE